MGIERRSFNILGGLEVQTSTRSLCLKVMDLLRADTDAKDFDVIEYDSYPTVLVKQSYLELANPAERLSNCLCWILDQL